MLIVFKRKERKSEKINFFDPNKNKIERKFMICKKGVNKLVWRQS